MRKAAQRVVKRLEFSPSEKKKGLIQGIIFGLVPHTFCILFVVLSIVGAATATTLLKRLLYLPYFFQIIVALAFVFAGISSVFYLRRNGLLSWAGARFKWKYLTTMFATTIGVNLLFFLVVFPAVANLDIKPLNKSGVVQAQSVSVKDSASVTLQVSIPCSGHAPLIIGEVEKLDGVVDVKYQGASLFKVQYDSSKITVDDILGLEVFKSFKATVKP
ncbi:MAG: hypothetical protein ACYCZF_03640 [Anaerolineae bacterium]